MQPPLKALLVPLDGSKAAERAVAPAARLARLSSVPLTLFHWDFDEREGALTGEYLETLAGGLVVLADVEIVINDKLSMSIADAAADRGATVCMATHGRGGVARAVLGSVAEEVLALLRAPTVLIGPQIEAAASQRAGRVMGCLDGSDLSEAGLPTVVRWASQLGSPLELVHVYDFAAGKDPAVAPVDVIESGYLQRMVDDLEFTPSPGFEVLHGDAAHAIADHAEADVELIAVATHGRTGLRRVAMGSVAMGVAHRARRPVLVIPAFPDAC